jgi:hypothetical protein
MGDETKETLIDQGDDDPLHATRKPSTADEVDERTPGVAEMPTREELERRHEERHGR